MKITTIILTLLALFSLSCATEITNREPQDGDIVMAVSGHPFTRYELKMFIQNRCMEDEDKTITRNDMGNWLNRFADYATLVAEAYNRHYDERESVLLQLDQYSKLIVTQQGGLFDTELVGKYLVFTEQDLRDVYEKQKQEVAFDRIDVDATWYEEHADGLNFDELASRVVQDGAGRYGTPRMLWPFNRLYGYRNGLYLLRPGQESPAMKIDDTYVRVRLIGKEPNTEQREFEVEKPALERNLRLHARLWREACADSIITERLRYDVNEEAVDELFRRIDGYEEFLIDEQSIVDIATKPLAIYTIANRDTLTVGGFVKRYNNSVFRRKLTTREKLHEDIVKLLYLDGYWQYAQELGVLDDPSFKLELQYREHALMFQALKKDITGGKSMPDFAFLGTKDTHELLARLRDTYPVENNIDAEYFLSEDTLSFLQAHIDNQNRSAAGAGSVPDDALQRRQPEGVGVGAEPADLSGADRSGD